MSHVTRVDNIANMLTKIRNSYKAGHKTVDVSFSRINGEIADILKKNKFIDDFEKRGKKIKKHLELALSYKEKIPAIEEIKRISKPGKKVYIGKNDLYSVKHGYGIAIISTSKGVMTNKEAKKHGVGGEVIAEVW
ncbi:MAG: 30S ribosomal protein S8 [Candidatus Sungbacteria bacterium RIFCSPLOWO2_12_FULL_41_11]|uniref:Small ribosomal subunit protein uS8 n=1 Tax=Candidatus Sungbacteria bacterium RIFCSPLOWO2_12_FULL_41_11 TaxID=1802286 RepID=A0A1G2LQL2_9BACT|nr:MAG: 30S ribosomal protein S8 [Parcubacteria group bacterium GW2011_GWA2_42_14]OGZ98404.1 MAG: 30S ribosomal protein S8 [Candidatus Sungbacteria bacterium RIFCSPHIGHO2_02_FULL_41_12b]OHA13928.1 MAG: 30S ribosomal protein S8 [Candidatus Sungbacteria bacterium RIFCSPLOWO2_12_FULL_41_11]